MRPCIISFNKVSKTYFNDIDTSRSRAMVELVVGYPFNPNGLRKGEFHALRDVSFSLEEGENLLVLGTPDSGKSTLARLICGLTRPTTGRVEVDGRVRMVKNTKLGGTPFMKLSEYARLVAMLCGADSTNLTDICREVMELCGARDLADKKLANVPSGYVKSITFYTSVLIDSDIYVFDENLVNKDTGLARVCAERIHHIFQNRTGVVVSKKIPSVDIDFQQALILHEGELVSGGDPQTVVSEYREFFVYQKRGILLPPLPSVDTSTEKKETRQKKEADKGKEKRKVVDKKTRLELEVEKELMRMLESNKPIIAGPFLSAVGRELLYWIPFIRWITSHYKVDKERITAFSRAGADLWYRDVSARYIDVFDIVSPQEHEMKQKERVERTGKLKQTTMSDYEVELLEQAAQRYGMEDYEVLHPSLMYRFFSPFWKGKKTLEWLFDHAVYDTFQVDEHTEPLGLPQDYVAVRFDYIPYFPDTSVVRFFIRKLVGALAEEFEVVAVNTGIVVDTLVDCDMLLADRFQRSGDIVTHRNNLEIQTQIISRARAFIGTQGGVSSIAPFCRTRSFTFYTSSINSFMKHIELSRALFSKYSPGSSIFTITGISADGMAEQLKHSIGGRQADRDE